jgi:hypothetical protein
MFFFSESDSCSSREFDNNNEETRRECEVKRTIRKYERTNESEIAKKIVDKARR